MDPSRLVRDIARAALGGGRKGAGKARGFLSSSGLMTPDGLLKGSGTMSDARWHLLIGGHSVGPLTTDEVRTSLANGSADRATLTFGPGLAGRIVSAASRTFRSEEGSLLDGAGLGRLFTGG